MVDYKSCPRCVGDIAYNSDMYGHYKECLQCGYMQDIEDTSRILVLISRLKQNGPKKVASLDTIGLKEPDENNLVGVVNNTRNNGYQTK